MILCSGTLGPIPFERKAHAAAAAGFTGISVYSHEYRPGLRDLLDDLGLYVAEVDGAMAWMPGQRGAEVAQVLDMAADLAARSVTVLETGLQPLDPALAADAFRDVCDRARNYGVAVHIEPFAWSGIATLDAALEIVNRADRSNGGILLDTWHHVRGPDAAHTTRAAAARVLAAQVSDPAPQPGRDLREECMTNRRMPGPIAAAIVSELRAFGCAAPLEVEVFGSELDAEEVAQAASRAARLLEPA